MPIIHHNVFNTTTNGLDFTADTQTFTIVSGITVASEQADGAFSDRQNSVLVNFGLVASDAQTGVSMTGGGAAIHIMDGGAIVGASGVVMAGANAVVDNAGEILGFALEGVSFAAGTTNASLHNGGSLFGAGNGVRVQYNGSGAELFNSGDIESNGDGIFVRLDTASTVVIDNAGLVQGDHRSIEVARGAADITNSGKLNGQVLLGAGADVLRNLGSISGGVNLGDGADVYDGRGGGPVTGTVVGGKGDDTLGGGDAGDALSGGKDNDLIHGRGGDDAITGGTGQDTMNGGLGADTFFFETAADALPAALDLIRDFRHADGDQLDLSGLAVAGMHFIGTDPFGGVIAGEVRYTDTGKGLKVEIDLGADAVADMAFIVKTDDALLFAADFIFV